jgi:predicted Zn-dependent protease with MMP-like domain
MPVDLKELEGIARKEVAATLAALPIPLRTRAEPLPVTLQRRPNAAQCRDGIEPDTLGLFVGCEFSCEDSAPLPMPPQIILFIGNLWDEAQANRSVFRKEVRRTYLHELGHYLGLDEDDLFERGLA